MAPVATEARDRGAIVSIVREGFPLILAIIAAIDVTVHWEVQLAFLLIVMLFTFSRSASARAPKPSRDPIRGIPTSTGWSAT